VSDFVPIENEPYWEFDDASREADSPGGNPTGRRRSFPRQHSANGVDGVQQREDIAFWPMERTAHSSAGEEHLLKVLVVGCDIVRSHGTYASDRFGLKCST
jgi:hypothetical protein